MQFRQAIFSRAVALLVLGLILGVFSLVPGWATAQELSSAEKADGFVSLFDGKTLNGWIGVKDDNYTVDDGVLVCHQRNKDGKTHHDNLFTEKEYADFIFRFEFKLTPAANNGVGIRAPLSGAASYNGMEIQILDDTAEVYNKLQEYQYCSSVYGIVPAKRGHLKPLGEWNSEEIKAQGRHITIVLNDFTVVDADLDEASKDGTLDHKDHPGLKNKTGHIGWLGHNATVEFRNIRVKDLAEKK